MLQASHHVYYDTQEQIIFIDYPNATVLTEELYSKAVEDLAKISAQIPHKVFVVVNLGNATVDNGLSKNYSKYYAAVLKYSRGILRYNAGDTLTQVTIRATTVRNRFQQMQSRIYPSREAAIAAVRELEKLAES